MPPLAESKNLNTVSSKIFGIGLGHTGTRSLNDALNILGYRSVHWPTDRATYRELSNGIYDLTVLKTADALTDITAAVFFAQYDKAYPGSKFIFTQRDINKWAARMLGLMQRRTKYWERFMLAASRKGGVYQFVFSRDFLSYLKHEPGVRHRIEFQRLVTYGGITFGDESRLRYVYETHERNVREYFADRPKDLLILDVVRGDGWDKLCQFLGRDLPKVPFPHLA
jgi:hypothetical protein